MLPACTNENHRALEERLKTSARLFSLKVEEDRIHVHKYLRGWSQGCSSRAIWCCLWKQGLSSIKESESQRF